MVTLAQRSAEIGLTGGVMWYNGELNPSRQFSPVHPAGGLLFRHNFNYRYSLRLTGLYGSVSGTDAGSSDPFRNQRGLAFESTMMELAAVGEFNFLPYEIGNRKHPFTTYVFGGLGAFKMNPRAAGGGITELASLPTEPDKKYSVLQPAIPFGFGVKFTLFGRLGFFAEWGMRKTFTDYIDDVSTTWGYVRTSDGGAVSTPVTGYQRGFAEKKDWYSYAGTGLVYLLKKKNTCPAYNK